jgi:DNA-binding MurR/RpiR family transcriptional regulator
MGIQTVTATESHMMLITSNIMNRDDLVIGISNSCNTIEVNRALLNAKKNGAKTAAITSDMIGPINQSSLLTLHVEDSTKLAEGRFINSQFVITYAIDILSRLLLENQQYNWSMQKTIE